MTVSPCIAPGHQITFHQVDSFVKAINQSTCALRSSWLATVARTTEPTWRRHGEPRVIFSVFIGSEFRVAEHRHVLEMIYFRVF